MAPATLAIGSDIRSASTIAMNWPRRSFRCSMMNWSNSKPVSSSPRNVARHVDDPRLSDGDDVVAPQLALEHGPFADPGAGRDAAEHHDLA